MRGRGGEDRKRIRHMWTVPSRGKPIVVADGSSSSSSSSSPANSFCKDGRKISVGDCALFEPHQDSPPFIGIIRWLAAGKENRLKLGVNWLYRRCEVKLGKGIRLEAEPNEVFYSFHKDEIPAASLLHPCKVAFLPKGVELPSGVSSFVCRRVYDITNKCLWWLTDKDYINERQEEVDQLLYKTRIEMHATVQPGGRSPKPASGPTSTTHLRTNSDSVQNAASNFSSQSKGKKRDRGDLVLEPVKRERTAKVDDDDSANCRSESILKTEIAKITEKGGLVDSEGVEKFVQLLLPDRHEKRIDLSGRSLLAGVIAATEKHECLSQFVHLKGLLVFDEWLQEIQKGKPGDGNSSKDSDKSVEEFLFVLLRALEKVPVNLTALQMCNIGKSVNHLRTQKNSEIQKKARSLVDTWKKRVEAEMNINDAKSVSNQTVPWPARSRLPDATHGGRNQGMSTEVDMKSSVTQLSTSKTVSVKLLNDEGNSRSASASPGSMKSVPSPTSVSTNSKDGLSRNPSVGAATDLPQTTSKDEKSSSSSQSHNNSQSCSSEHGKSGGLGKEEARSSTAGSISANKISGSSSRQRKSVNGFPGSPFTGVQREVGPARSSSLYRNAASERQSQSGIIGEKVSEGPVCEGNSHKLIVKIPNRGRSPSQSASGGSSEDPTIMNSRASSPVLSEKHDQFDRSAKDKSDAYRIKITSDVNAESWQSNDVKEGVTRSDEGDEAVPAGNGEECCPNNEDTRALKAASPSYGNEQKNENAHEAFFGSKNALIEIIESCVRYSEVNASTPVVDDGGMNLLASVATGEMTKSDLVSPTGSPQGNTPAVDCSNAGSELKVKASPVEELAQEKMQSDDVFDGNAHGIITTNSGAKSGEAQSVALQIDEKSSGLLNIDSVSSGVHLQQTSVSSPEINLKTNEIGATASSACKVEKPADNLNERKSSCGADGDAFPDSKSKSISSLPAEGKVSEVVSSVKAEKEAVDGTSSHSLEGSEGRSSYANERLNDSSAAEQKAPAVIPSASVNVNETKAENDEIAATSNVEKPDRKQNNCGPLASEPGSFVDLGSAPNNNEPENVAESLGNKQLNEQSGGKFDQETEQQSRSRGSKLTNAEAEEAEESTSTTADASSVSATGVLDVDAKVEFDLNEGFSSEDGKSGEPLNLTASGLAAARLISPVPFPVSTVSSGFPASITVAAAAKGAFVPPDDLLRTKGEPGWKGSAATSAFRPAEPRKAFELPLGTSNIQTPDATASKKSRPPLDIDLNIPDERILEDTTTSVTAKGMGPEGRDTKNKRLEDHVGSAPVQSSGGLDLDLNLVDEAPELSNFSANVPRVDGPRTVKLSTVPQNGETSVCRDFDLNGPIVDDASFEQSTLFQNARGNGTTQQPPVGGLWMNNSEMGNFSSWFPPGNSFSGVTIPSIIPDRAEQPFPIVATGLQRMLGPTSSGNPYRGPVLLSSPAVSFPSTPFQYPAFPFGNSFPLPSASFSGGPTSYVDSTSGGRLCFPAVPSPLLGPTAAVSTQYPRPYVVSLPDGSSNSSSENSKKSGRGLDLNVGPGIPDLEGIDEAVPLGLRQLSVASSQTMAEEQVRMFQPAGGVLKRKEPEGGWDGYKQSSWH